MTWDDEQALWGDADPEAAIRRLQQAGVREIVLKNGAAGATYATGDTCHHIPAERVEHIVDTTAAGDAFNAGYLAARLQGADPVASCKNGNRLAARVIQHKGAIIAAEHSRLN